ncbi:MAG: S1 RNA-binding domain-containing protein [Candidatus Magasanikbacteria bacterium]|nr:S1 RNA-binding domain-containing protein [Candidatus Magasanikbacteria bacterium]
MVKEKEEKKSAVGTGGGETEFGLLLAEHIVRIPKVGDIVKGIVISDDSKAVRLDVNGLTTGVIRGRELFSESSEFSHIAVGDEMEATVIEQENENGEMELSFRSAGHQRVWDRMGKLLKDGLTIPAKVLQANKGGLMVQVDALVGFMPVSQLNPDHYPRVPGGDKNRIFEHLRSMIGQALQVKVIDINQKEEKLIVSEKAVWEDEQKAVLDAYKIGDTVEGEISALTSFGAFIKFGEGLEGLVHISEIVWQRIDHPRDVLKIGERAKAVIIDLNKSKIYLSMKRLVEDPWKKVKEKYAVGQVVEGQVHKVEPFGLMVKLDDEIHGLAHVSEVSDTPIYDVQGLRDIFTIGKMYRFEIVNIEPAEHRLGLKLEGVKGKSKKKAAAKETATTDEDPQDATAEKITEEK